MSATDDIDRYLGLVSQTLSLIRAEPIERFIELLRHAYDNERDIYVFGNGGSGATAAHIAGDFAKGVSYGLDRRFRVRCLNDNVPALTAIANDIGYSDVFVEQLRNVLRAGDLVVGLSGSGNSENVVRALQFAKEKEARTVAFCGYDGGRVRSIADVAIHVPVDDMEVCEDVHLILAHCCKRIMKSAIGRVGVEGSEYAKRIHGR